MKKLLVFLSVCVLLISLSVPALAVPYSVQQNDTAAESLFSYYFNSPYFDVDCDWVIYKYNTNNYGLFASMNKDEHLFLHNGWLYSDGDVVSLDFSRKIMNSGTTTVTYNSIEDYSPEQGAQADLRYGVIYLGNIEGAVYPQFADDLITGYQIRTTCKVGLVFVICTSIFCALIFLLRRFF